MVGFHGGLRHKCRPETSKILQSYLVRIGAWNPLKAVFSGDVNGGSNALSASVFGRLGFVSGNLALASWWGCVSQHPPRFKKNEDLDSFSTAISDAWTKMPKIFSQMVISRWFTKVQSKKRHLKQARGYQTQTMQGFCKGNPTNSMRSPW